MITTENMTRRLTIVRAHQLLRAVDRAPPMIGRKDMIEARLPLRSLKLRLHLRNARQAGLVPVAASRGLLDRVRVIACAATR
jgi:hypothetical protein